MDETQIFSLDEIDRAIINKTLNETFVALKEKGYDPVSQIVGYLNSGDITYITNYKNARKKISEINRALLLEMMVKKYIGVTK